MCKLNEEVKPSEPFQSALFFVVYIIFLKQFLSQKVWKYRAFVLSQMGKIVTGREGLWPTGLPCLILFNDELKY